MNSLLSFIDFMFKNYLRSHRYLPELIGVALFVILFEGFLLSDRADDSIWYVFSALAIVLNLLTCWSMFFFESGNTLHFLVSKPYGRRNLFVGKICLILLIDIAWVAIFALLYGMRFPSVEYFSLLPLRMLCVAWLLLLSTLLFSLHYTFRPQLFWLIFLIMVLGIVVRKSVVLELPGSGQYEHLLLLLLPPFQEIISVSVSLDFGAPGILLLMMSALYVVLLAYISSRKMMTRDLI